MKKLINKVAKKKADGNCYFCGIGEYEVLEVHRIVPGCEDGKYTNFNTVTLCGNCHSLVHAGRIIIDRKYQTSLGKWVLHYWINGEEKWS